MKFTESLIIAVDFDGTIVENAYPKIGKPKLFAFETLIKLQNDGHRLILWTFRSGKRLEEAIEFCKKNEIAFYAVNQSFPDEKWEEYQSRKIHADVFIDDRNIGGFIGWGKIYQMLIDPSKVLEQTKRKKGFWSLFQ